MAGTSRTKVQRLTAGVALVGAAPLSVASWMLLPESMVEGENFVANIASASTGRAWASMVTGALFFPMAILAVMGLSHLMKGRENLVGVVGAGLAVVGLSLNVVAIGAAGTLAEAVYAGNNQAETARLVDITMSGATGTIALCGVLLGTVGTLLLGIGLYRSRAVPRLWAVLLAIYGPIQLVGFGAELIPFITLSYAVMALAMIPIGLQVIGGTDDGWDTPPSYDGFRTATIGQGDRPSSVRTPVSHV
jgi:hypothetical protein